RALRTSRVQARKTALCSVSAYPPDAGGDGSSKPADRSSARAIAMPDSRSIVYVSSAGSREVLVLSLDRASGRVEPIEAAQVPGGEGPSPTSMPLAVSPDRRFLYAAVRSEPFPAVSFAIDPRSGRLTHIASCALPDAMAYIVTDRTGRYLLSASYHGSKLATN